MGRDEGHHRVVELTPKALAKRHQEGKYEAAVTLKMKSIRAMSEVDCLATTELVPKTPRVYSFSEQYKLIVETQEL